MGLINLAEWLDLAIWLGKSVVFSAVFTAICIGIFHGKVEWRDLL